jgi:hypothetical protein
MYGNHIILLDWLEPYQIWNGFTKIRGGFTYFTDAILPDCLWSGDMLFCPVLSTGM